MNKKSVIWSGCLVLMCLTSPLYGKVNGFKETHKVQYGKDTWHTYEHMESGLEVIWIENEDMNKALTIGVKTPTTNDTGVNHIIEHTVFTGSKNYPSPSVFFDASEAYPSTYMNALTSGDMTIFPFSTPYLSCYNNLRQIYLDAVFCPKLLEQPYGFYEEGFHSVPQEERYSGVVYNEMKGANSSLERTVYRAIRQTIYAESHYAYDSGGKPNDIPTLTYEEFVDTYKRYYYPGNMKIIVYGDLPIEETLESILPYVEGKQKQEGIDLSVEQINPVQSVEHHILPIQDKGCIVKAFVLKDSVTAEQIQALDLWMSAYLMSPQTYFQSQLLSLGIQAKWFKDEDVPYPIYAIAVSDIPLDKMEQYSNLLDEVFENTSKRLSKNVFLEQDIIKQAKWALENQENSNNRGILIAQSILDGWAHHREENQYYLVKAQVEDMEQLDAKISKLLFKEATRYTLTLLPGRYTLQEPSTLSPITQEEWRQIYGEIQTWQKQKSHLEAVDLNELVIAPKVLPKITQKEKYWEMETRADTTLARSILYINTSHLPQDTLPYLYLYSYLLEESAQDITPFSGMISTQCTAYPVKDGGYWPCFKISMMTELEEKEHGILFNEARSYLKSRPDIWYQQKLIELTKEMKGGIQSNALATLSHLTLGAQNERGAYLYQQSYPLYRFCQSLLKSKDSSWIQEVKVIDETVYHTGGTILATTLPEKGPNKYAKSWEKVLKEWPYKPNVKGNYEFEVPDGTYVIYNPADVDYSYINLYKQEGIQGSDYLLAAYLTKHYLNPQIRVKLGAYGAGCQIYDLETMGIYTYRDPDYRSSLPVIYQSGECLKDSLDALELQFSKAEALNKVHGQYKLLAPPLEQSGIIEHLILWGKSPKEIIHFQKDIIMTTPDGIKNKIEEYENLLNNGKTAIMTRKSYTKGQSFTFYRY